MFINIMYLYMIRYITRLNNILKYKKIFNNDIKKNHRGDITHIKFFNNLI